ncbi:MAG: crotonyl-CoA carboxylase/reductase [Cryomorphaceae bacterium]|jgi:crotonyl-CoA carboxylase/reductase
MKAQVVREERYGDPLYAYQIEDVNLPELKTDEVRVKVMAAGLNYNNIWAARGYPINLIKAIGGEPFHVIGSDASGIVEEVGVGVTNVKPGDEIVVAPIWFDRNDPGYYTGEDPTIYETSKAWGFETNWGSLAEYCLVKEHQCVRKPKNLSWEEAATIMLSSTTAYRMLTHWHPHNIKKGDVVAIWGGSGGLGVMAIQICQHFGAIPVCIVSTEERKLFCEEMGAKAILRTRSSQWGALTSPETTPEKQVQWRNEAKTVLKDVLTLTGGKWPNVVLEHPGEQTLPTSIFICGKSGMVVTCAGTTGYLGTFDLRYLWLAQKRLQGSHGGSHHDFHQVGRLFETGALKPVVSKIIELEDVPMALDEMQKNLHKPGSVAVRIGCATL